MSVPVHLDSTLEDSNCDVPHSVVNILTPGVKIQDYDSPSRLPIPVTVSQNESDIQSPSTDGEVSEPGSPSKIVSHDLESGKVSLPDPIHAFPTFASDRMKRRLASAYFVYFLCGWGDGGVELSFFVPVMSLS
jgi:hypothetical protein